MTKKKPLVVVTRKLPEAIETRMMELFDARLNIDDAAMTKEQLIEAVKVADVLVPTVTDKIDAAVLAHAGPNLRLIANFGTGVDHVDLQTARSRGITVTNTPDVLTEDTADMTMALILSVSRRLAEGERLIRKGEWAGWGPTLMLGHRIWGKRLGIVGMGRIGRALARRAKANSRRSSAGVPSRSAIRRALVSPSISARMAASASVSTSPRRTGGLCRVSGISRTSALSLRAVIFTPRPAAHRHRRAHAGSWAGRPRSSHRQGAHPRIPVRDWPDAPSPARWTR